MPSQASMFGAQKRKTPPASNTGRETRLIALLERARDLAGDGVLCRACASTPCPIHQLRRDIEAELRPSGGADEHRQ